MHQFIEGLTDRILFLHISQYRGRAVDTDDSIVPIQDENGIRYGIKGSSLKSMGNSVRNMLEIHDQEIEEVDTDRYERHGSFSVGLGFESAMVCGVV
jgi:hypothetical protein